MNQNLSSSARQALLSRMASVPLVAVIRASTAQAALGLARAIHRGGLCNLEITLTVPQATHVITQLREELGETAVVGAGTITRRADAVDCSIAGAQFLVSPGLVPGLVDAAHTAEVLAMQGALSPSEVIQAHAEGTDVIKIFPCSAVGGPAYLRLLRGPFPHLALMPSGGVQLDNLSAYLQAGATLLGLGSALADEAVFTRQGPGQLSELAQKHVKLVQKPSN